ncbi:MAG: helix-turn-helix transcriptional regulator [Actinobacteria bacterium]|nr:helix-turn-helix transcriptional regulator [Actinomycetota bacterium]MBI3688551.1 helix-turn-helix transcriptional regulator [Actinomycetota bacterium]
MRAALAGHDIATVFRLIQGLGYSQNAIGTLIGLSQPEVSSILHGRRVRSYAVLARIGSGLGIPPGHLGVAWCACPDHGRPGPAGSAEADPA